MKSQSDAFWNEAYARSQYQKSVEMGERFFAKHKHPENPNGHAFFDLSLAMLEVRKHLVAVDCFSTREALTAELRRLLNKPVFL